MRGASDATSPIVDEREDDGDAKFFVFRSCDALKPHSRKKRKKADGGTRRPLLRGATSGGCRRRRGGFGASSPAPASADRGGDDPRRCRFDDAESEFFFFFDGDIDCSTSTGRRNETRSSSSCRPFLPGPALGVADAGKASQGRRRRNSTARRSTCDLGKHQTAHARAAQGSSLEAAAVGSLCCRAAAPLCASAASVCASASSS